MQHEAPAAEVKNHFADYVRLVEGGDEVVITRYGKRVAALVAANRVASDDPSAGLAGLIGLWPDGCELADALDALDRPVDREPPSFGP